MDVLLQRHCARYIYVIPDGLRELMSDISREVLRDQPRDVYTFIADYLDALLITRENARVAVRLVEVLTETAVTTAAFLQETGIDREDVYNIVQVVQDNFQQCLGSVEDISKPPLEADEIKVVDNIMANISVPPEQADTAAIIIQEAYRRFKLRKDRERQYIGNIVDWQVAARTALNMYRKTQVTNEEANRAATLIKAAYKGYYTRRLLKVKPRSESDSEGSLMIEEMTSQEELRESVSLTKETVSMIDDTSINESTTSDVIRYSLGVILHAAECQYSSHMRTGT